ncbi:unnamed protein product [Closterium sp. NIES-54]
MADMRMAGMRMAGVDYSTTSYIIHVVKGLLSGYNLMRRMLAMPGVHELLDKDTLTIHIIKDEAIQEAERPTELLPQANYAARRSRDCQRGQRGKSSGGGSGGGRSVKDAERSKTARDNGRGGGGQWRECWICGHPM